MHLRLNRQPQQSIFQLFNRKIYVHEFRLPQHTYIHPFMQANKQTMIEYLAASM